jgi:transcriptional regulator with XRE-family HTH domain
MKTTSKPIQNRIKKYRKIMGYKQKELAFLLGLQNYSIISRWESGSAIPGIVMLFKLSILFRTLPSELYFELTQELRREITMREKLLQNKSRRSLLTE